MWDINVCPVADRGHLAILLCDSLSHSLRKGLSVNLALTIIKLGYLAASPSHPSVVMPPPPSSARVIGMSSSNRVFYTVLGI